MSAVQGAALITLKETLHFVRTFGIGNGLPVAIVGTGPVAEGFCFFSKLLGATRWPSLAGTRAVPSVSWPWGPIISSWVTTIQQRCSVD